MTEERGQPKRAASTRTFIMPVILVLLVAFWAAWDEALLQPPIIWIFTTLWTLCLLAYAHVSCVAPGRVPADYAKRVAENEMLRKKFCSTCNHWKPPRCKHCSVCNRCVLGMDHHCAWIGNCVGFKNRKFFMQFISYTWLLGVTFAVGLLQHLLLRWNDATWPYRAVCVAFLSFCSWAALSFSRFLRYHWNLVSDNYTTLEEMFDDKSKGNPLDCGLRVNLEQIFGRWLLLAWLPSNAKLLRPVGDGSFWPTQQLIENEPLLLGVEVVDGTTKPTKLRRNRALLTWGSCVGGASWAFEDDETEEARINALLAELFDLHDLDKSGSIDKSELKQVAMLMVDAKTSDSGDSRLQPKDTSKLFQEMDSNKDGRINRREFSDFYRRHLQLSHADPRGQLFALHRLVDDVRALRGLKSPPTQSERGSTKLLYSVGERVLVWSNSEKKWSDGKVLRAFDRDAFVEGYAVRAGTYKVQLSSVGAYKWLTAAESIKQMKKASG